ncbi:hypothetical protein QUF80_13300 [Desulfococcaceae bacterium HSG8]|nr:hypothetical protein [Desulfococcaceae bacterium HSG8]
MKEFEKIRFSIKACIKETDDFKRLFGFKLGRRLAEIEAGRYSKKIRQMNSGKLGDDMDIMEWMGLYENLLDFQDCHNRIKNTGIIC